MRSILKKVRKLEKSKPSSHFLRYIVSLEKWEEDINNGIVEGRLCKHDAPFLIDVMRRWIEGEMK